MRNGLCTKGLVVGIIMLFVGACIVQSIDVIIEKKSDISYNKKVKSPEKRQAFLNGPLEQWNKTFGGTSYDRGYSGQQTSDGGYIITGFTCLNVSDDEDIWLIKTDSNGNEQWNRTFEWLSWSTDEGYSVQQTTDGGYIIVGFCYVAAYETDAFLLKTDSNGFEQWHKTFSSTDDGCSVQQTTDGGYILLGLNVINDTNYDLILIKTNSNGLVQWEKTYGGLEIDYSISVRQTTDSGYIILGDTNSYGAGNYDIWLIKVDNYGNTLWNRTFGGNEEDYGADVQQTTDGGYIITGETYSYANPVDVWLIKTDGNGTKLWDKIYGDIWYDHSHSVDETADGGFIIAGQIQAPSSSTYDAYLIKTDENGVKEWDTNFGGSGHDCAEFVQQTTDGQYILIGWTFSYGANPGVSADVWLFKTANHPPIANYSWTPKKPNPGQVITFRASSSEDPDGIITLYEWDWNNDSVYEESYSSSTATHSWSIAGNYQVTLRVTDNNGATGTITKTISINQPPNPPTITGPVKGKVRVDTYYNFTTTDPNSDDVYYFIEWGDETNSSWIGTWPSEDIVIISHTWSKKGTYTIKAKAKDTSGLESDWGQLSVTMPCSYNPPYMQFWIKLFERFPNAFPILRHFLGY